MSDNEPLTPSLELIATIMNELAGEIGAMEPADPQRADFLNELSDLMQVRRFLRVDGDT